MPGGALFAGGLGEEPRAVVGELPVSKHGDERLVIGNVTTVATAMLNLTVSDVTRVSAANQAAYAAIADSDRNCRRHHPELGGRR